MAEIKLYKSPWRGVKLIAGSMIFVILGIGMILRQPNDATEVAMAWGCTIFFGFAALIGAYVVLDRRPQITINESGVWDRMSRQGEIKWEQLLNAYPITINGQKFISVIVSDDFVFKKKPAKWATFLNKFVGAQEINLNLSQIKIDENAFSELLNKIVKADKAGRNSIIRNFDSGFKINSDVGYVKYLSYALIVAIMWSLSLYSFTYLWIIFGLMGVGAIIAKWYLGTTNNSKLRKYAETIAYLGLINMVLLLVSFKLFDYSSEKVGKAITIAIEKYKQQHDAYPKQIDGIINSADFNFFEKSIANSIQYKVAGKEYVLSLQYLNFNQKEYDPQSNEWY